MKPPVAKYATPAAPQRPTPSPSINPGHADPAPNGPVKNLRLGRVKAAVWENTADDRTFYNVTFSRLYVDEAKKLQNSGSFGRDDLLLLSKLADQAHTFICERLAPPRAEE